MAKKLAKLAKATKSSKPSSRVTLASLRQQIADLKAQGMAYVNAVQSIETQSPYHYKTEAIEGKLPVVGVNELYAHVLTAEKLGYTTELNASPDGKLLRVHFVKRPRVSVPYTFF